LLVLVLDGGGELTVGDGDDFEFLGFQGFDNLIVSTWISILHLCENK